MREIKFRAWTGTCYEFITDLYAFEELCIHESSEEYPVEQFTGLRDKNGREIYEGDIVETYSEKATESFKKLLQAVVWFRSAFVLRKLEDLDRNHNGSAYWWINDYGAEIKIVGNIHENPELLA